MNKKGYTLAEALITLGIIGIIAALVVPAANKARPNENKIRFLQTYDTIETQIKNFTQNSRYFPTCQVINGTTRCFPDYPLFNTSRGADDILRIQSIYPANNARDNFKLCYLFADAMGVDRDDIHQVLGGNVSCSFTTSNNIYFRFHITRQTTLENNNIWVYLARIIIDVEGRRLADQQTLGGATSNDYQRNRVNPSTFRLFVTADGNIYPGDFASEYYLNTRKNTRGHDLPNNGPNNNTYSISTNGYGNDRRARIIFSN